MTTWKRTPICISVHRETENPVFGETSTKVCLEDEAGGYFFSLEQWADNIAPGKIRVDVEELNEIVLAVQDLLRAAPEEK